ncbi:MAG TPA: hypothetical protein VH041_14330 [Caldimonas sp.]|jgi:hypothetical protein|nr:hypothetical protein [Caldimonas sp.]HEX4235469.1 hypothetical protein [Caldimonas sp.]
MNRTALHPRALNGALAATALAAMLVAGGAGAADKTKPASTKKSDAVLTPEQLRDCLDKEARKNKATDAALKAKAEIAAQKAEIDRSGAALGDEATTLDRTSEDAVNAYNEKIDERDKQIAAYEAKVAGYNKDTEAVRALEDAYAKTCSNRRYDDRDLSDIQRSKK